MEKHLRKRVEETKQAALDVLLHNAAGPFHGLPRTAGWGYPEPYTRDLMISALGILASPHPKLVASLERVLRTLAKNQSRLGHVPSLVHDPDGRGASDTTPLFLIGLAAFRKLSADPLFLEDAARRALQWMEYQSPEDRVLVAQEPTSDWRDEHWVPGYGLYVNTLVYTHLCLMDCRDRARLMRQMMNHFAVRAEKDQRHVHEGLVLGKKPYYALWSYKLFCSERFDLLGNSLAILSGIASPTRARHIISWVEIECARLRRRGELALDLPPCLLPYIRREDPDWRNRYEQYNLPGEYHNGGVWPFICGFYVAAAVAAGRRRTAERNLAALTDLARPARNHNVAFGFNEWFQAQDGTPRGQDWQTWSAAMYLYAATAVQTGRTPLFKETRANW